MQQPWIHKAKTDSIFILSPSVLVVSIVFLFQKQLQQIETKYSFYTWRQTSRRHHPRRLRRPTGQNSGP